MVKCKMVSSASLLNSTYNCFTFTSRVMELHFFPADIHFCLLPYFVFFSLVCFTVPSFGFHVYVLFSVYHI